MKNIMVLLLLQPWCLFGQIDTIWFNDSIEAVEFDDSINRPNGYPRQNTSTFQGIYYDSVVLKYYSLINKVTAKGLNEIDTIWREFQELGEGDTVWYNDEMWYVRQSHYSSKLWTPNQVLSLFYMIRTGDALEWISNESLKLGDVRIYNSVSYEVIQAHISQIGWEPPNTPTLFALLTSGCNDWIQPTGAQDAYNIGDCVTFNSIEYESLINGNVWSPTIYPAGWQIR